MKPFKRMSKYNAKRTNGYASRRESAYADLLAMQKRTGLVSHWLEQVPVKLPGGIRYVCDFLVFYTDGSFRYVEVKGMQTASWRLKLRLIEESQPEVFAKLEIVK